MTRQQFDALVERIEARYANRRAALERATAGWVMLGLLGIVFWTGLLLVLGAIAFFGGVVLEPPGSLVLLGIGVLLIASGVLQAGFFLLVEVDPPHGRKIRPTEAPALWNELGSLRQAVQSREFSDVLVSMDFNAGVRELPRLGLFGWPKTILEIGLPLCLAVTPEELRAILAHEYAHISARHARSGNRVYRIHRTWANVFQHMQRPASTSFSRGARALTSRFVGWYWPRLHARAFVLSRAQEYEADRLAAGIAGAAALTSGLWRMACLSPWLSERFWPDLFQEATHLDEPPDVFARLKSALEVPPSPDDAARWTSRGMSRVTGTDDTHPAFCDRAAALGVPPNVLNNAGFPAPIERSAAVAFLGTDAQAIEQALEAEWRKQTLATWHDRRRRFLAECRRAASTDAAPAAAARPEEIAMLWNRAREAADLRGLAAAEPLLREVLAHDPRHAGANVLLGLHFVKIGDAEGERRLSQVIDMADRGWFGSACEILKDHYRTSGQTERVRELSSRQDRFDAVAKAADRERSQIDASDDFREHALCHDQLEPVQRLLATERQCGAAWLVRKTLEHYPDRPLFVLCVQAARPRWGFGRAEEERGLVRRLVPRIELPGQVLVIASTGYSRRLARKVMAVPGALAFRAEWGRRSTLSQSSAPEASNREPTSS
jgi:Peptidase family M48